ncbi:acylphosphatase [Emcibacter sp. SYSU 3D8]|uniref:acylphosphatase n=1 Tax=Emcibacter sp. SYSU 3D8 TaxID=3133969 RepID=UPI0031FF266F
MSRTVISRIRGSVQGVGFRAWVLREATRRGLRGWVRNRQDGSVEAMFSGPNEDVIEMMMSCYLGPPGSKVSEAVSDPSRADPGTGFEIRETA